MATARARVFMLDPVGQVETGTGDLAERVSDLNGKTLGFIFNGHYSARVLFARVRERLEENFKFSEVIYKLKPNLGARSPKETIEELASKCDVAVVGVCA